MRNGMFWKMVNSMSGQTSYRRRMNTWLGETGGKFPEGSQNELCFVQAPLENPKLLILDETAPFNGYRY